MLYYILFICVYIIFPAITHHCIMFHHQYEHSTADLSNHYSHHLQQVISLFFMITGEYAEENFFTVTFPT